MLNTCLFRAKEPETPVTPDDSVTKEFAFVSPPAIKSLPGLDVDQEVWVTFFIRCSTTGHRGVIIKTTYSLTEDQKSYQCHLTHKLNLETVEPFGLTSELLR